MIPAEENRHLPLVLIDTPVWEEYFRKKEGTYTEVNLLMDAGRVCSLDLVVGELLATAETPMEMKVFQDFTRIFPILPEPPGAWVEAARLSFRLRRRGKALSLRESYLAVLAKGHGALLYTDNPHFREVRQTVPLKLFTRRSF